MIDSRRFRRYRHLRCIGERSDEYLRGTGKVIIPVVLLLGKLPMTVKVTGKFRSGGDRRLVEVVWSLVLDEEIVG
jgi:hypothetical protein